MSNLLKRIDAMNGETSSLFISYEEAQAIKKVVEL